MLTGSNHTALVLDDGTVDARPEFGCLQLACNECSFERLVAWSCKRRGSVPAASADA
jgi:hypothetical protein